MTEFWDYILWLIGLSLCMPTVLGNLELMILTFGAFFPLRPPSGAPVSSQLKLAFVVPAHNEEQGIGMCINSLKSCQNFSSDTTILVVADNCTDHTAEIARKEGARVFVRQDAQHRGKGYALDFAFQKLLLDFCSEKRPYKVISRQKPGRKSVRKRVV